MTRDIVTESVHGVQVCVYRALDQGRYEFERVLAVGGQGVTLIARDTRLAGNRVLIKVPLHGNSLAKGEYTFLREKQVHHNLILYEVSVVCDLTARVQNVPRLVGYFRDENAQLIGSYQFGCESWAIHSETDAASDLFLVYEFLSAGAQSRAVTLQDLIDQQAGPLDESFVLRMADQITDVLAQLHDRDQDEQGDYHYIYQDLKPANILVTGDRYFFLIDFGGLVRCNVKPKPGGRGEIYEIPYPTGAVTPGYAAPEAFDRDQRLQLDRRFDIFSLGATMFHALSGVHPVHLLPDPANTDSAPSFSLQKIKAIAPNFRPSHLTQEVVFKATQAESVQRYRSIQLMRTDVLKALGEA
jgi:serine/threonine protein kinase